MITQIPAKFHCSQSGNPAWHGMASTFPDEIAGDLSKVLEYTGLDWDVLKVQTKNHFTGEPIPNAYGLYNSKTYAYFGPCKSVYTPVNNYNAMKYVHELMTNNDIVIDSIAEWSNGLVAVNYRLFTTEVVRGDEHIAYFQAVFGHDGLTDLKYFQSHTRMVCKNTVYKAMRAAMSAGNMLKHKHTTNVVSRMVDSIGLIQAMNQEAMQFVDKLKILSRKMLTVSQVNEILNGIYGEPKILKGSGEFKENSRVIVEQLFADNDGTNGISSIRGTAYNLLNGITQYETHAARINIHGNYNESDRAMIEAGKRVFNQIKSADTDNDKVSKFFELITKI